ncbi:MAG: signal peptidase II [Pirellulales bacterium]|nr:signal peptidase II [Pirellulales bacterium]
MIVAAVVCAIDLATKSWIFSWPVLQDGAIWWIWHGHIGFQKSLNEGALFGLGQGGVAIFAAISIIAALAIPIWLFVYQAARDRLLTFSMALVMGGILGNLYDRLGLHQLDWAEFNPMRHGEKAYAVRDWILWQWNDAWRWPNFNIADSMLVCGACLLLWHGLFIAPPKSPTTKEKETLKSTKDLHS